jgi:hypothetical protein
MRWSNGLAAALASRERKARFTFTHYRLRSESGCLMEICSEKMSLLRKLGIYLYKLAVQLFILVNPLRGFKRFTERMTSKRCGKVGGID